MLELDGMVGVFKQTNQTKQTVRLSKLFVVSEAGGRWLTRTQLINKRGTVCVGGWNGTSRLWGLLDGRKTLSERLFGRKALEESKHL